MRFKLGHYAGSWNCLKVKPISASWTKLFTSFLAMRCYLYLIILCVLILLSGNGSWKTFAFFYLQISDQLKSRFASGLSLPQICENFIKAAYDPRIAGIYLHIEPLDCGWGKVEEIRRHILDFKKSGRIFILLIRLFFIIILLSELYTARVMLLPKRVMLLKIL